MADKRKKKPRDKLGRHFSVTDFAGAAAEDRAYWAGQSVAARLRAMELMRRLNYGDAAYGRMEKVFEVVTWKEAVADSRPEET